MGKILIVGAGIAGLAVARKLDMADIDYRIIERNDKPSVQGCGLALPFNAVRALRHFDLHEELLSASYQVSDIVYEKPDGTELCRSSLHDSPFENDHFVALKRTGLHEVLLEGIQSKIEFGTELVSLERVREGVNVTTSSGTEFFDLVVAADGIRSNCRLALSESNGIPIDHGYQTWRFLVEMPGHTLQPTYTFGGSEMFMHYPVSADTIYCYGHAKDSLLPNPTDHHDANLKAVFAEYRGVIPELISLVQTDNIILGRINSVQNTEFCLGRVVFIGDSGSGCPPTLQQGAAKAFEDAICLVKHIETLPIDEALDRFSKERKPSVDWVVQQSNFPFEVDMDTDNLEIREFRDELFRAEGPRNLIGWRELATDPQLAFSN